jgi:peptide/nickel transport system substrate-binding protein
MRRRLGTAAIAAASVLAVAACGSSSSPSSTGNVSRSNLGTVIFGTLPPNGTPTHGGTITMGQLTGQTPTYIFPIVPAANVTTGTITFVSNLFMPLYAGPTGARPQVDYSLSAANPLKMSDNDTVVTIPMKHGLKWANGAPIQANDVVFFIDLLKAAIKEAPSNWSQFSPGLMPQNVLSAKAVNQYTVQLKLNKPTNPGFMLNNNLSDTNNFFPIPSTAWNIDKIGGPHLDFTNPANAKKIYDFLNAQGKKVSSFASSPLWKDVSGPFKLTSFSPTNSSYTLVPNPSYGGSPKPMMSQVQVQTYTSYTSELNAVKAGSLDFAVGIDPSQLGEAASLKAQGIDIYGGPGWGWFGGIINFKDATHDFGKVISQAYVRQAMEELINEPAIIQGAYKGAAVPSYTTVPSAPSSPYTPTSAVHPIYGFNPSGAVALLKSHGWKVVPNGTTTCQRPGTGPSDCGAGIPKGTPITFTWWNQPESVSSVGVLESSEFASEAKSAAGINVQLKTATFNFLTGNYDDQNPADAKYTNQWGVNNYGGLFEDYYPTQEGVENPGAGFNYGDFNDPTANRLMKASVSSSNPDAVKAEANYFAKALPVLYFPDQDYLLAVNTHKMGSYTDGWTAPTQQEFFPQYFYALK